MIRLVTICLIIMLSVIALNTTYSVAKEKIVFLAGGNAWQLFEAYLNKEGRSVKLGDVKVKIWDGREFKEYKINWTEYLSGEGLKSLWKKKLNKVEAKYDLKAIDMAKQYGWEIFVVEPQVAMQTSDGRQKEAQTREQKPTCSSEAVGHINLGLQFVQNKQIDNAIKEFTQARNISPTCALAYANLVSAYVLKKNFNLAVDTYKEGLNKAGEDGFLHITGAIAYAQRGDQDYALQALEKALRAGFKDRKALEDPDLNPLFKTRKSEVCQLLDKHGIILKRCL